MGPLVTWRRNANAGTSLFSALFLALFALASAAMAQSSGTRDASAAIFTIRNVGVDVTAQNAAMARTMAIAQGQRQAYDLLMRRLLRDEDRARLPAIDPVLLNALVQGFEISGERSSAVRYLADLTFRFDSLRVRDHLRSIGVPFSQTLGRPILVLPVMEWAGLRLLWEEENSWFAAWRDYDLGNRLITFLLPEGTMDDRLAMPVSLALDVDEAAFRMIGGQYDVDRVIVPHMTLMRDFATGGYSGRVVVRTDAEALPSYERDFEVAEGENPADVFRAIVADLVTSYDDWWKERTLIHLDETGEMVFRVPLRRIEDWPEVRRRLEQVTLVESMTLLAFRPGEASLRVNYVGARAQAELALGEESLRVHSDGGENYLLLEEVAQDLGLVQPRRPGVDGSGSMVEGEAREAGENGASDDATERGVIDITLPSEE